jgi:hypothetical protein
MGYSKVVKVSDHKVKLVHQLNPDGTPYAEDITIETAEGVDEGRLGYLAQHDGKVGYASVSFSPAADEAPEGVLFPEE